MKGFIGLTSNEKEDILKKHSKLYDGYAVGNVNTNMYPLTTYNDARDSGGLTVTNNGEVKTYINHKINEITAKPLNYDEIDQAYEFESDGPQQSMTQMGMGKKPYEFKSKGPSDVFNEDECEECESMESDLKEEVYKTLDMFKRFNKFN
jgi:hypothetical protein